MRLIDIFLGDYSKRFHVRQIARHYGMNHVTVSRKLRALEEEGTLKHRMVGRNRMYFLNLSNWLTHTKIGMAERERLLEFIKEGEWQRRLVEVVSRLENYRLDGGPSIIYTGTFMWPVKDSEIIVIDGNRATRDSLKEAGIEEATCMTKAEFIDMLKRAGRLSDHVVLRNEHKFVNLMWDHWIREG